MPKTPSCCPADRQPCCSFFSFSFTLISLCLHSKNIIHSIPTYKSLAPLWWPFSDINTTTAVDNILHIPDMSSGQLLPPNYPQQPGIVFPNNMPAQPHSPSQSHSNGSFGTVFIVLAIIAVISVIACCLGRFCNRKAQAYTGRPKQRTQAGLEDRHGHTTHPPMAHDVESGFDTQMGHEIPKLGKQTSRVGQDAPEKENKIEFSFEKRIRAPKSGFKPTMEGGFDRERT